ncbi:MAG: endolytic transglycosylase MltG [Ferrovibrio sp.]|uniref:endolytic transglycosylase MltG n=1 Tax=Ferrovibrio sp. TaxID=1917215 RepID=UPI002634C1DE|nr:endolytic transglycosylase MltG [Ferrovibrio sp.]MCW0235181.1 endolytic transglycosylase MltG [Ferrovibrio sp.]
MNRLLRALLAVLLAGAIGLCAAWLWYADWLDSPGPLAQERVVLIPRGTRVAGIAEKLAEAAVVRYPRLIELAAWQTGTAASLKAGEYQFVPGDTPRQVLERIAAGKVFARRLTVPEGQMTVEIRRIVEAGEALAGTWPAAPVPEGSLLPETYQYIHGDSRSDLVARMRKAHEDLLAELWPKRAAGLPLASPDQAVILASIVEAETPIPAERARVAGVYLNRLKRRMKLQADPTVAYGITRGERELERPLTLNDLAQPSAWNTYTIDGLPPTPINHPGRASIGAVLRPESHDFLYFVADGKGGHVFARTYDEHLRNVAAYRASQRR